MPNSQKSPPSRIGFFGGSFDPFHIGHLSIANQAIQDANLDLLIFCPAYHAPLREKQPLLPASVRYDMLNVIASENNRMEVSTLELDKQKTCYNTIQYKKFRNNTQQVKLFSSLGQTNLIDCRNGNSVRNLLGFAISWFFLGRQLIYLIS